MLELDLVLKGYLYSDDENWEKYKRSGATDAEIKQRLNDLWGESFGADSEGQIFTAKAGKNPRVWLGVDAKESPTLEGKPLMAKIREILDIPPPKAVTEEGEAERVDAEIVEDEMPQNPQSSALVNRFDLEEALAVIERADISTTSLSEAEELAIATIELEADVRVIEVDQLIGALYWILQGKQSKGGSFKDICARRNYFGKSLTGCYEIGQTFYQIKWAESRKALIGEGFDPKSDIKANSAWLKLASIRNSKLTPKEQEELKIEVLKRAREIAEENDSKIEESHFAQAIEEIELKVEKPITRIKRQRTENNSQKLQEQAKEQQELAEKIEQLTGENVSVKLEAAAKTQELAAKLEQEKNKAEQLSTALKATQKDNKRATQERDKLKDEIAELQAKLNNQPPPQKPVQLQIDSIIKKPDDGTVQEKLLEQRLEVANEALVVVEADRNRWKVRAEEYKQKLESAQEQIDGFDRKVRIAEKNLADAKEQSAILRKISNTIRSLLIIKNPLHELEDTVLKDPMLSKDASLGIILTWRKALENIAAKCEEKDILLGDAKNAEEMQHLEELVNYIADKLDSAGFGEAFYETY